MKEEVTHLPAIPPTDDPDPYIFTGGCGIVRRSVWNAMTPEEREKTFKANSEIIGIINFPNRNSDLSDPIIVEENPE